eukprot:TRINITY_DN7163_c0_g1_i1.p1 TRINITY_DN7163_c0_g1~~TRINITY_DN7163_c0_g1_i1.p1  ORF type:complete len:392 (+),score=68.43 TRINITY_DN7163_c0_g1_i1:26-1177(+)
MLGSIIFSLLAFLVVATQDTCFVGMAYRKIMVKPSEFGSRDFAVATRIVEVQLPPCRAGHIVVRVASTGIEASDIIQMSGGYGALSAQKPEIEPNGSNQVGDLGCEGVGLVTELGEGVDPSEWSVGQPVAFWGFGVSFREFVTLRVSAGFNPMVWKVPDVEPKWTAVPISAMTAVGGLVLHGGIGSGQNVLVTGAAGGTGHIAVQWAKRHGARVAGTCGGEAKVVMLKSLGCDVVVNYRTEDVEAVLSKEFPEGFDLVYDGVGGSVGNMAKRLLSARGSYVSVGSVSTDYSGASAGDANIGPVAEKLPEQKHSFFFMPDGLRNPQWPQLVADVVSAVASDELRIVLDDECSKFPRGVDGVYPAQARMRSGKNVGKIYATISSE